ncbi:MAG: ABC transporter ATP-binding protein [Pirellulaceae bacterium]|nr:ABC transporter ATP-binding protein [Pirellulaceae bacterium]
MPQNTRSTLNNPNEIVWQQMTLLIQSLGMTLNIPVERGEIHRTLTLTTPKAETSEDEALSLWLMRTARSFRIRLASIDVTFSDAWNLLADGFSLVCVNFRDPKASWWILESVQGRGVSAVELFHEITPRTLSSKQVKRLLVEESNFTLFLVQPALLSNADSNQSYSNANAESASRPHEHKNNPAGLHHEYHLTPLRRIGGLLSYESSDLFSIAIFSFMSVILGLATPLTIEILVNTIGFGRSFQPIFILSLVLLGVLFLSSAFKLLQIIVVELMQRRFLVRIVGDLAHRLPNANRSALEGIHGPELVNRFFDIMTLQKSAQSLLLDGVTIVMQTLIGTLLLAFYHPYLLGFDVVLILCMTLITYLLGRGGARTAIQESIVKYSIAHWLQDVIACPTAFKLHGGADLCLDRANRLTVDYLVARRRHFLVLIRQIIFALLLLPLALTSLYALGGYLVINNQLTLGQLVAAELVVGVIVGAFAKSGKIIESFYDLMAATDKVGHLLDLFVDPPTVAVESEKGAVEIRVEDLCVRDPATHEHVQIGSFMANAGERIAIAGSIGVADSMILPTIAGLLHPAGGFIEIGGLEARDAIRFSDSSLIGYAGPAEFFSGTISENICLGRSGITDVELRNALELVELWDELLRLPAGLNTRMQTGGSPFCEDQLPRIVLARAIVIHPRALLIDWVLDSLPLELRHRIWDRLRSKDKPWTLLLTTHDQTIIEQADKEFRLEEKHRP